MAKKARVYDGTAWQELASAQTDLTAYSTTAQMTAGFRNAIINGKFDIWQRGTSFTPSSVFLYTADRFFAYNSGNGSMTVSRQAFTPGNAISGYESQFFMRTAIASVGTSTSFITGQRIEDVRSFAGQTVTVSFWMKSDASRTVTSSVYQNFGTGGSADIFTAYGTFNVTTSWQRFTATVNIPSISGKTIGANSFTSVEFYYPLSTQTTEIWGLQVEAGSVATPFEQRPIGTELALCQRYYYKSPYIVVPYILFNTGNVMSGMYLFPVTMRTVPPSITYYDGVGTVNRISIANAGGTAQNNISPPNALNILNSGWNFGAGGMGGTAGNNGNIMLSSYEASAEL